MPQLAPILGGIAMSEKSVELVNRQENLLNDFIDYTNQLEADHARSVKVADELILENKNLREQLVATQPSEAVNNLLDLIQPDIEWQEQFNPSGELMKLKIAAFRQLRPKDKEDK